MIYRCPAIQPAGLPNIGVDIVFNIEIVSHDHTTLPRSFFPAYSLTSHTVRSARHKNPITPLTPTLAIIGTLDATRSIPLVLALDASAIPEKRPLVLGRDHLAPGRTRVGLARAVRGTGDLVVLVVGCEDGKGLRGDACVVAALGGLDGARGFGDWCGVRCVRTCGETGKVVPEQAGDEGYLAFVFELAGARVAVVWVTSSRRGRRGVVGCIVRVSLVVSDSASFGC
jgi:hypothetical protein